MTVTQFHIRRHLNGEHNHWCSKRTGKLIICKFTGRPIKQVVS